MVLVVFQEMHAEIGNQCLYVDANKDPAILCLIDIFWECEIYDLWIMRF